MCFRVQLFFDLQGSLPNLIFAHGRYFKYELEAKGAIQREDLPTFLSGFLDRNSADCMYTANQLRTFTTAHLSGGGWYLDCPISYTHPSEVDLRNSLEGIGAINMEVDEFVGLTEKQKQRAIARRETNDRRKAARIQLALENKEKKEAERLAKLEEKEKEREKEKEEKAQAKGKKKEDGSGIPASSIVDEGSQMQGASQGGIKRKSVLPDFTEEVITQGTQVIALGDDDDVTSEELLLSVSIVEVVDNEGVRGPNPYTDVLEFLRKVIFFGIMYCTFQLD